MLEQTRLHYDVDWYRMRATVSHAFLWLHRSGIRHSCQQIVQASLVWCQLYAVAWACEHETAPGNLVAEPKAAITPPASQTVLSQQIAETRIALLSRLAVFQTGKETTNLDLRPTPLSDSWHLSACFIIFSVPWSGHQMHNPVCR